MMGYAIPRVNPSMEGLGLGPQPRLSDLHATFRAMHENTHPNALAVWTGSSAAGTAQLHVFDLTVSLEALQEREDFGALCSAIEFELGVLDYMGDGADGDVYEGFGTDVEPEQVAELIERFASFLTAHGLLAQAPVSVAIGD
jgi:hypothetical protein